MKRTPLFGLLALAACATVSAPATRGPIAGIGQAAVVDGLHVRPTRLVEDSRCPASVQCVWAGQVRVLIEATRGDAPYAERVLTLGEPQDIDWGMLTLAAVTPPKRGPGAIDSAEYRFTFRFEPRR